MEPGNDKSLIRTVIRLDASFSWFEVHSQPFINNDKERQFQVKAQPPGGINSLLPGSCPLPRGFGAEALVENEGMWPEGDLSAGIASTLWEGWWPFSHLHNTDLPCWRPLLSLRPCALVFDQTGSAFLPGPAGLCDHRMCQWVSSFVPSKDSDRKH